MHKTCLWWRKNTPTARVFFGGDNDSFVHACNFLFLNEDNNEFTSFSWSDMGQNIMTNNKLSIHIETGDIFYNDFNTKETFYNFLLAQQGGSKQFMPKRISYHYSFEKYMGNYLPSLSIDEIEKLVCCQIKTLNTCCISLMIGLNFGEQKKMC